MMHANQRGFSLVELSIVILVMGLLLGGLMMPLSVQRENKRLHDGRDQLESVRSAIEGFALVNGYLPCPAIPASDGYASPSGGGCSAQHGFVPGTTLDLNGQRNTDNLLLDPWGAPIRYSVSASDSNTDGAWDFVTPGQMKLVTMPLLQPELTVCSTAAGSTAIACGSPNVTLTESAPLIVYSIGKNWSTFSSADEVENVGANLGGGASGTNYQVASDAVFIVRGKSELPGSEFDDLVTWSPANRLYGRLVDTGHLP